MKLKDILTNYVEVEVYDKNGNVCGIWTENDPKLECEVLKAEGEDIGKVFIDLEV